MKVKLLLAGLSVVAGAGLIGAGIAQRLPSAGVPHTGYLLGAAALLTGVAGLVLAVASLFRNS